MQSSISGFIKHSWQLKISGRRKATLFCVRLFTQLSNQLDLDTECVRVRTTYETCRNQKWKDSIIVTRVIYTIMKRTHLSNGGGKKSYLQRFWGVHCFKNLYYLPWLHENRKERHPSRQFALLIYMGHQSEVTRLSSGILRELSNKDCQVCKEWYMSELLNGWTSGELCFCSIK